MHELKMHTIPCDTRPEIFNKPVTVNKYTLRKITIICKQIRRDPSQNAVWVPLVVFKTNAKNSLFICQTEHRVNVSNGSRDMTVTHVCCRFAAPTRTTPADKC